MFRRKTKLEKVLDKKSNYVTFRDFLKSLSHKELHILAEEIIWKEYDGIMDYLGLIQETLLTLI